MSNLNFSRKGAKPQSRQDFIFTTVPVAIGNADKYKSISFKGAKPESFFAPVLSFIIHNSKFIIL